MTKRPKVIDDLLAVDDTGTVANYIRQLEAELSALLLAAAPPAPTAELSELKHKVTTMRIAAQECIRDDAWRWPHVQPNVLESVVGAIGEISVVEAREGLARIESEAAPPERVSEGKERELCSRCEGNGVIKIHHGVRVCPRCQGDCWEPAARPAVEPREEPTP